MKFKKIIPLGILLLGLATAAVFSNQTYLSADGYVFWRNDNAASVLNGTNGKPAVAGVTDKGVVFVQDVNSLTPTATATVTPTRTPTPTNTPTPTVTPTVVIPIVNSVTEITPIPMVTVLATSVPSAFGTPVVVDAAGLKTAYVNNTTNQEVWCAYNGSSGVAFPVPALSQANQNLVTLGLKVTNGIACKYASTLPTSGNLEIGGAN
jgi:hypothetical protein